MKRLNKYAPTFLALLRIAAALLFIEHGTQKLFGFPAMGPMGGPPPGATGDGPPALMLSMMAIAGWLEFAGGIALLLGFLTRPVAFILAGEMAIAYWLGHFSRGGFFPLINGGEAAILFCFIFLYLVFAGPGRFAVDSRIFR